jgi:chemotaxis signal transduction protein/chemotaxis methyl-accepting protein methylase
MSALDQMNDIAAEDEQQRVVDYKMVTFTLGGKDYGVDIMDVKEISKAERLTPVPNTAPYVRGVINLRGEIISTIDLRRMLNLPDQDGILDEAEDVIFINVDDHLIGIIVDSINDVIGIDSSTIQAPHPLFGEVNLMYIDGVVEYQSNLYIILDTEAIFGADTAFTDEKTTVQTPLPAMIESIAIDSISDAAEGLPKEAAALSYTFITETLFTFKSFAVSEVNDEWVRARFDEWTKKKGPDSATLQLKSHEDAEEFLTGFYSTDRDVLWSEEKAKAFSGIVSTGNAPSLFVWDAGCGEGREAYSIASALKVGFANTHVKIWAQDSDLMKISNAPNLVFGENEIPEWMRRFTVEGSKGSSFSPDLSESIVFEYHDILNENQLPAVSIVIAKDILSFLAPKDCAGLLSDFGDKLAPGGILIVGDHERIPSGSWTEHETPGIRWYTKTV